MVHRKEKGCAGPLPKDGGARYTLETYRDDRLEANVRRIVKERNAPGAENLTGAPDSLPATASPRRRGVLRETSMPSAFEYVNYNMPETVPQEVVAGRQVARDMADPGIYSGGPRVTDIIHQPPRHATLSPLMAVQRSSRVLSLSRDRAMAEDENLAPLSRPYIPRGIVDAFGEPHQQIRSEGGGVSRVNRGLQQNLRTVTKVANPNEMDFTEVQAAANVLKASETNLRIGRNEILDTLQDLLHNWSPVESILNDTRLPQQVTKLTQSHDEEVAQLAKGLMTEWRDKIRVAEASTPIIVGSDPFVDEGAEQFGRTISSQAWDEIIRHRKSAAQDYNNATSAEIRAAEQRRRGKAGSSEPVQDARDDRRNTDSTITDPDLEADTDADADAMPTGNQSFDILEVNPSPERPQHSPENNALQVRPEDVPVQSIEADAAAGLCHECPIFRDTYHHICDGNPQCANLQARTPPQRTSPSYGPSQSPQGVPRTTPELLRAAQEGLDRLRATARANAAAATHPVTNPPQVPEGMPDPFAPRTSSNRGLGIRNRSGRDLGDGTDEVSPNRGRMPRVQREGTPTVQVSGTPQVQVPATPQVQVLASQIAETPRPSYEDYAASSIGELVTELRTRGPSPSSAESFGKDSVVRMLMTYDTRGIRGNGAPSGLNSGVTNTQRRAGSSMSPLDLNSSTPAQPVRESTSARTTPSGSGACTGNKRPASSGNDEPVGKRLRSNRGNRRTV